MGLKAKLNVIQELYKNIKKINKKLNLVSLNENVQQKYFMFKRTDLIDEKTEKVI